jgi:RNA polymerase sigma factor (sigma-70 family)
VIVLASRRYGAGGVRLDKGRVPAEDTRDGAFDALLDEFRPALIRFFSRRVHAQHEIEDLVHDVLVRLVRNRGFADYEGARGYVFQTANSVLVDYIRRRSVRPSADESLDPDAHGGEDFPPDRVLEGKQELARATAVLLELPERTRTVFVLRRIEGMRFNDIAERLGISVSAVEKHMQRAMARLVEDLGKGGA